MLLNKDVITSPDFIGTASISISVVARHCENVWGIVGLSCFVIKDCPAVDGIISGHTLRPFCLS